MMESAHLIRQDGFVLFPGAARELVQPLRELVFSGMSHAEATSGIAQERIFRLTSAWSLQSGFVQEMVERTSSFLRSIASRVEDVKPQPSDATLFVKSALNPTPTHAHQDIAYKWSRPLERRYALTTWLALDEAGPGRGGLSFLCEADQRRSICSRQDFLAADFVDRSRSPAWHREAVPVSVQPGDVVVFDATVWHAADRFEGEGQRCALAVRWASQSQWERAVPLPSPEIHPTRFGMDTSGRLLVQAIGQLEPGSPSGQEKGDVLKTLQWLAQRLSDGSTHLPPNVQSRLRDLEDALWLAQTQGVRPTESVWLEARDCIIPALLDIHSTRNRRLS